MHGKAENTPSTVSGSIIHTANSYALTGLEMETVRDNQGKKVRYEDTQRPLLLSTSGNAAHALLLLSQAAQLWARALYPQVEGCGLPAAVRARISSVEASLTMCPASIWNHQKPSLEGLASPAAPATPAPQPVHPSCRATQALSVISCGEHLQRDITLVRMSNLGPT